MQVTGAAVGILGPLQTQTPGGEHSWYLSPKGALQSKTNLKNEITMEVGRWVQPASLTQIFVGKCYCPKIVLVLM